MTSRVVIQCKWSLIQCWTWLLPLFTLLFYWVFFIFLFLILSLLNREPQYSMAGIAICRCSCLIPGVVWWPIGFRLHGWPLSLANQPGHTAKTSTVSVLLSPGLGISLQFLQVLRSHAFKFLLWQRTRCVHSGVYLPRSVFMPIFSLLWFLI